MAVSKTDMFTDMFTHSLPSLVWHGSNFLFEDELLKLKEGFIGWKVSSDLVQWNGRGRVKIHPIGYRGL